MNGGKSKQQLHGGQVTGISYTVFVCLLNHPLEHIIWYRSAFLEQLPSLCNNGI